MGESFAVSRWLAGSIGLPSDESSDSWVAFTMNGSLEMGNVCACDATSNSQCSVSKRTPETHNYTHKFLSREHRNTPMYLFECLLSIF